MFMRSTRGLLPASVAVLSLALFAHRLWEGYRWGDFLGGLFTGFAFSLAVYCLVMSLRGRAHE